MEVGFDYRYKCMTKCIISVIYRVWPCNSLYVFTGKQLEQQSPCGIMSHKSHGCSWRRYPVMETSVPWVKRSMGMGLVDNLIPTLGWCGVPCFSSLYLVGLQVNPASSEAHNGVCHQQYGSVWSRHSIQSPLGSTSPGTLAWWVWSSCTCSLPSLELIQDCQLLVLQMEGKSVLKYYSPCYAHFWKGEITSGDGEIPVLPTL